jgi:hypothetical protein
LGWVQEPEPSSSVTLADSGAAGDGVTDDTVAIQLAIDTIAGNGGGTVVVGSGRYLVNSANLVIPQGVFLEGFWENLGEQTSDNYSQLPCVILLNPAYTVRIAGRDAGIKGVAIINSTLATPITLRNVLDGVNSFSGTGITVGTGVTNSASDFYLGHLFIMGFAQGIHIWGNQERPRVEYIAMDNTAGYLSDGCSDVGGVTQMRCWPYFGAHLPVTATFAISNCTNNGSGLIRITCASNTFVTGDVVVISGVTGTTEANGRWTVTFVNSTILDLQGSVFTNSYASGGVVYARNYARNGAAFDFKGIGSGFNTFVNLGSYGYDIGIKIEGGDDYDNLVGCWNDNNLAANDPTTIGVWILNSGGVSIDGHIFSSQGTAIRMDVSGRAVNRTFVTNSRIFGVATYTAQLVNGHAHFVNCTFGSAPIRVESTGGQYFLTNCDLVNATFSYGAQNAKRPYINGCVTSGNVATFQPTSGNDTQNSQLAKWSGPGRATPAANDTIFQSYYMMNSAGNMVEVQRDHHRIDTVTAGSEVGEYYLGLVNGGTLTDFYTWNPAYFMPLVGGLALGGSGTANRWGNVYCCGTAIPAGGTAGNGINLSTTSNFGIYFGSGVPTLSAAQGSLYLRSDGSSTSTRLYVNTNGSTGWTNVTTAT